MSGAELLNKGFKITPYTSLGYGALVVVLAIFCLITYRDAREEREFQNKLYERQLILMTRVEDKLPGIEIMSEIRHEIREIKAIVSEKQRENERRR